MAGRNWSCLSTSVHPLMVETVLIAVQQFGFPIGFEFAVYIVLRYNVRLQQVLSNRHKTVRSASRESAKIACPQTTNTGYVLVPVPGPRPVRDTGVETSRSHDNPSKLGGGWQTPQEVVQAAILSTQPFCGLG